MTAMDGTEKQRLQSAMEFYTNEEYEQALQQLDLVLQNSPHSVHGLLGRAACELKRGNALEGVTGVEIFIRDHVNSVKVDDASTEKRDQSDELFLIFAKECFSQLCHTGSKLTDPRQLELAEKLFQAAYYLHCEVCETMNSQIAAGFNDLGLLYKEQCQWVKAEKNLEAAILIDRRIHGPDSAPVARGQYNLGSMYRLKGDYPKAAEHLQQALRIQQIVHGEETAVTIKVLKELGLLENDQGHHPQAKEFLTRALSLAGDEETIQVAEIHNSLGIVTYQQRLYEKAERHYLRSLEIIRRVFGEDSVQITPALENLGLIYSQQGDYLRALENYAICLRIEQRVYGPGSRECALTLNNIGYSFDNQGDYSRAHDYYLQSLIYKESGFGEYGHQCASTNENLGAIARKQGRYGNAERYYDRALHIREQAFGADTPLCAVTLQAQGILCYHQQQTEKANTLIQRVRRIVEQHLGTDNIYHGQIYDEVGTMYYERGDLSQAESNLAEAVRSMKRVFGHNSSQHLCALQKLGDIHREQEDYPRAEKEYHTELEIVDAIPDTAPHSIGLLQKRLGDLYLDMGRGEDSLEWYQKVRDLYQSLPGLDNRQRYALALLDVARVQHGRGVTAEALDGILQAKDLGTNYQEEIHSLLAPLWTRYIVRTIGQLSHLEESDTIRSFASLASLSEFHLHLDSLDRDVAKSKECSSKALRFYEQLKRDHRCAASWHRLGRVFLQQQDYEEAKSAFASAESIYEERFGPQNCQGATVRFSLGELYCHTRQWDEALECFEMILPIYNKAFGPRSRPCAGVYHQLGVIFAKQHNLSRAQEAFDKEIRIHNFLNGPYCAQSVDGSFRV